MKQVPRSHVQINLGHEGISNPGIKDSPQELPSSSWDLWMATNSGKVVGEEQRHGFFGKSKDTIGTLDYT